MEIIAASESAKIKYDKTIVAEILTKVDEKANSYRVKYQDSTFIAYGNKDTNYKIGTKVMVLIPESNFSNIKTIIREASTKDIKTETDEVKITTQSDFLLWNKLLVSLDQIKCPLNTANKNETRYFYSDDESDSIYSFSVGESPQYIKKYPYQSAISVQTYEANTNFVLTVSYKINTNITELKGKYGIKIIAEYTDEANNKEYTFTSDLISPKTGNLNHLQSQSVFEALDLSGYLEIFKHEPKFKVIGVVEGYTGVATETDNIEIFDFSLSLCSYNGMGLEAPRVYIQMNSSTNDFKNHKTIQCMGCFSPDDLYGAEIKWEWYKVPAVLESKFIGDLINYGQGELEPLKEDEGKGITTLENNIIIFNENIISDTGTEVIIGLRIFIGGTYYTTTATLTDSRKKNILCFTFYEAEKEKKGVKKTNYEADTVYPYTRQLKSTNFYLNVRQKNNQAITNGQFIINEQKYQIKWTSTNPTIANNAVGHNDEDNIDKDFAISSDICTEGGNLIICEIYKVYTREVSGENVEELDANPDSSLNFTIDVTEPTKSQTRITLNIGKILAECKDVSTVDKKSIDTIYVDGIAKSDNDKSVTIRPIYTEDNLQAECNYFIGVPIAIKPIIEEIIQGKYPCYEDNIECFSYASSELGFCVFGPFMNVDTIVFNFNKLAELKEIEGFIYFYADKGVISVQDKKLVYPNNYRCLYATLDFQIKFKYNGTSSSQLTDSDIPSSHGSSSIIQTFIYSHRNNEGYLAYLNDKTSPLQDATKWVPATTEEPENNVKYSFREQNVLYNDRVFGWLMTEQGICSRPNISNIINTINKLDKSLVTIFKAVRKQNDEQNETRINIEGARAIIIRPNDNIGNYDEWEIYWSDIISQFTLSDGGLLTSFNRIGYSNENRLSVTVLNEMGQQVSGLKYTWKVHGIAYDKHSEKMIDISEKVLRLSSGQQTNKSQIETQDKNNYCNYNVLTNRENLSLYVLDGIGVSCTIENADTVVAYCYTPIKINKTFNNDMGISMLNEEGTGYVIKDIDGKTVATTITNEIVAGRNVVQNNGTEYGFCGITMGELQPYVNEAPHGDTFYGFRGWSNGIVTAELDVINSKVTLGNAESGQIVFQSDMTNNKPSRVIQSGDYKDSLTEGKGLQIDFSVTPSITFGNHNFMVDKNGYLTASGATIKGNFLAENDMYRFKADNLGIDISYNMTGPYKIETQQDGTYKEGFTNNQMWISSSTGFGFKNSFDIDGEMTSGIIYDYNNGLTIKGNIQATAGTIAGWRILTDRIESPTKGLILHSDGKIVGFTDTGSQSEGIDYEELLDIDSKMVRWYRPIGDGTVTITEKDPNGNVHTYTRKATPADKGVGVSYEKQVYASISGNGGACTVTGETSAILAGGTGTRQASVTAGDKAVNIDVQNSTAVQISQANVSIGQENIVPCGYIKITSGEETKPCIIKVDGQTKNYACPSYNGDNITGMKVCSLQESIDNYDKSLEIIDQINKRTQSIKYTESVANSPKPVSILGLPPANVTMELSSTTEQNKTYTITEVYQTADNQNFATLEYILTTSVDNTILSLQYPNGMTTNFQGF